MARFTAAIVQMRSGTDVAENVSAMEQLVRHAAVQGATFVQTPEMTGLVQRGRAAFFDTVKPEVDDQVIAAASALARELEITLHIGSTPIALPDMRAANRAYVFGSDGRRLATYDKIHMFDVDLDNGESWRESAIYKPGREAVLVEACDARIGLGICYDCRFPELTTTYARAGADILTAPACFTRQTGEAHWHILLRSRAIENGAYVIAAAQGGAMQDGRETFGHSLIIDPWGEVIAEVNGDEPGVALAEVDTHRVVEARARIPNLINNRAFTLRRAGEAVERSA
ncbi:MAG: carbon-nitrogen hydrolase family protein [Ahrensia sp.]|nr:carbon-nitrogen hydrolase family protein [Ahrensia sp.]